MKKLMFAGIAALCATVAVADGIESANVVGYQSITIDKQYTILGCNFKNADNSVYAISNFIPYVSGMVTAKAATGADQIQVRQPDTTYKIYFMCNGYYGKGAGTYYPNLDQQWVSASTPGSVTTDTISNGTGFWFIRPTASFEPITLTVAGGVETLDVSTKTLEQQYNIIANPYPVDLPVTNIPYASGMVTAKAATGADQIQVRQPDTTYKIYFMCNGYYGKGAGTYYPNLDQQWVAAAAPGSVTTDTIPAGAGFWYIKGNASADVTLTFNSPVK